MNLYGQRNTKDTTKLLEHLTKQETKGHLQYFVEWIQFSGYPQLYRYEVMSRAFKIHTNKGKVRRDNDKKLSKTQKKFDGVMFIEVSKNSEVKNRIQAAYKENKLKIKDSVEDSLKE